MNPCQSCLESSDPRPYVKHGPSPLRRLAGAFLHGRSAGGTSTAIDDEHRPAGIYSNYESLGISVLSAS